MAPTKDHEIVKNEWETDSIMSADSFVDPQPSSRIVQQQPPVQGLRRTLSNHASIDTPHPPPNQGNFHQQSGHAHRERSSRLQNSTSTSFPSTPRKSHSQADGGRWTIPKGPKGFAKPQGLVTTRNAILKDQEAAKYAEMHRLRSKPDRDTEFVATGYYLWPKGPDPMKLFDSALAVFDFLREAWKVHIDWDENMRSLRINCIAEQRIAEHNVASAINGIKLKYLDAQTQIISATTLYIIVPPTSDAIRSAVRPINIVESESIRKITSIELAGERLIPAALSEWETIHRKVSGENFEIFRSQLYKSMFKLQDSRRWMRMRIQFGHVNLSQYPQSFLQGKYSFGMFADMMRKNRVATGGTFDRKMEADIVLNIIQKIVGREQDFAPRSSRTASVREVVQNPRHTEIILVSAAENREQLRLEAEIESVQCGTIGKYQIGHTRLFTDDTRNKRAEITTVDIQSKFDWSLEIIEDSEVKHVPQVLQKLIAASLDHGSDELVDSVGMPYPAIALRSTTGYTIKNVVIRSVFQYQWISTSNVVEIAIYREWLGVDTRSAPKMQASISMFGADWDSEMSSIENTMSARNWDKHLHNFFGQEEPRKRSGLKGLMTEIRVIQDLLTDACLEAAKIKLEEADEAEKESRQEAITKERAMWMLGDGEQAVVCSPIMTDPALLTGLHFDDTPNPDGSLI